MKYSKVKTGFFVAYAIKWKQAFVIHLIISKINRLLTGNQVHSQKNKNNHEERGNAKDVDSFFFEATMEKIPLTPSARLNGHKAPVLCAKYAEESLLGPDILASGSGSLLAYK